MNPKQLKLLIGGAIVLLGITYLIYSSVQGSKMYYLTVEEFLEQRETISADGMRLAGTVVKDSIRHTAEKSEVLFAIHGKHQTPTLRVYYQGIIPDLFQEGGNVILEGRYNQEEQVFHATTLMTSCPSKYKSTLHEEAP